MLVVLLCAAGIAGATAAFRATGVAAPYSKGAALAVMLSAAAAICLGQNYTQSLIAEASDGIAVSNAAARWIIGEDNWTVERFRAVYERSLYVLLASIAVYPAVLIAETLIGKKKRPAQR